MDEIIEELNNAEDMSSSNKTDKSGLLEPFNDGHDD